MWKLRHEELFACLHTHGVPGSRATVEVVRLLFCCLRLPSSTSKHVAMLVRGKLRPDGSIYFGSML